MNIISRSKYLGMLIFFLPLISVNSILILSQSFEFRNDPVKGNYYKDIKIYNAGDGLRDKQDLNRLGYAIPYIDGTTSISRLGRVFPNSLIFKPLMVITGVLICLFWNYQRKIFDKFSGNKKSLMKFYRYGLLCGITLILHTILLGIKFDNNLYKFLFRLNLATCVLSGILAKFIFVNYINRLSEKKNFFRNIFFNLQYLLSYALLIILFISLFLLFFDNSKKFILIIEWNYFVAIFLFYLLYSFSWKKINL